MFDLLNNPIDWIRMQNIQLKLFHITVTFKYGPGRWNCCAQVQLNE